VVIDDDLWLAGDTTTSVFISSPGDRDYGGGRRKNEERGEGRGGYLIFFVSIDRVMQGTARGERGFLNGLHPTPYLALR
jgi:hypothetical protein